MHLDIPATASRRKATDTVSLWFAQWLNWDRDPRNDEDYLCNAASWAYQVGHVFQFSRALGTGRYLQIKYEGLCTTPQMVSDMIAAFLDKPTITLSKDEVAKYDQHVMYFGDHVAFEAGGELPTIGDELPEVPEPARAWERFAPK